MNDDVQRYLDGEVELNAVAEERRGEAASWSRLLETFRTEAPSAPAPPWLETRVMAEIESLPEPGMFARAWAWLMRPQQLQVSPAVLGMAVAAFAVVLLLPTVDAPTLGPSASNPAVPVRAASSGQADAVVYVQFVLTAPGARSVSVGGDFDEWQGNYALEDADGDGVWTGRVPVQPGVHEYMFLVDGSDWVTDPEAARYTDDGFGNRNAVLAVAAPAA